MPRPATTSFSPPILTGAAPLLERYDVLFCDVWGVLHDGIRAFAATNDALTRFRAAGGSVVLVSNAPSPPAAVATLLHEKGVARTTYDTIVSSGEQALDHISTAGFQRIHRIGPLARDSAFFAEFDSPDCPLRDCDAIACTGLHDDTRETGESYRERLRAAADRQVPFVCANPDLVVHVGDQLLPCAGAIATVYEDLGGPVVWSGKPHASAYRLAFAKAARLRDHDVAPARVLAIGDAVRTDLAGAARAGIDALFITTGIHRDDVMRQGVIDPAALEACLSGAGIGATAAMAYLRW